MILNHININKNILVDIDNTIIDWEGNLIDGAVDAINKLVEKGYKIIFYSCRNNNSWFYTDINKKNYLKSLEADLKKYGFKDFTISYKGKPEGLYIIDDLAIKFDTWEKLLARNIFNFGDTIGVNIDCIIDKDNNLVKGAKEALEHLWKKDINVTVTTNRDFADVKNILDLYEIAYNNIDTGINGKPFCERFVEPNAIEFSGNWEEVLKKIIKE
jgi:phosphoglycolate phosphatase-like HAD superfamily hydrolase